MLATNTNSLTESAWYLVSGAPKHITYDLSNLGAHSEYHCSKKLHIGTGLNFLILVPHFFFATCYLSLKTVLSVSSITKRKQISFPLRHNDIFLNSILNFVSKILNQGKFFTATLTIASTNFIIDPHLHYHMFSSENTILPMFRIKTSYPFSRIICKVIYSISISLRGNKSFYSFSQ